MDSDEQQSWAAQRPLVGLILFITGAISFAVPFLMTLSQRPSRATTLVLLGMAGTFLLTGLKLGLIEPGLSKRVFRKAVADTRAFWTLDSTKATKTQSQIANAAASSKPHPTTAPTNQAAEAELKPPYAEARPELAGDSNIVEFPVGSSQSPKPPTLGH